MSGLITTPGVYDMPPEVYHADPVEGGSLSSTGVRKLLPPSCPAMFAYEREHPPEPKREFDIGHAAHRLVLGAGQDLTVIEADNYRTKAAQEARDDAHASGRVPLLRHEHEQVLAMVEALRAHPEASALLDQGRPEQALIWRDEATGVWCRALLDRLPDPRPGRRMILPEYKSARSAAPERISRAVNDYGYHIQLAWYRAGVTALGLAEDVAPLLVVQEKTPPYLVTVAQLSEVALMIGRDRAREAIAKYAECVASGRWPGYSDGYSDEVVPVGLPAWIENQYLREMMV